MEIALGKRKQLSVRTRFEIFKRDVFTCRYCGKKSPDVVLEIDHIIPVADNGTDDEMNLATSCFECNSGKSDKPLSQMITGEDPHDKAIKLLERERQLKEYNAIRRREFERTESELRWLNQRHEVMNGEAPYLRRALQDFSVYDVDSAMDIATAYLGNYWPKRIKYFCGIMKNKRRENGEN